MERQDVETKAVSLKDLWRIFLQRAWIMALVAVAAVALMLAYVKLTFVPRYQSTATVYILSSDTTPNQNMNNEFSLALSLMKDCDYILKSHAVLDEVAEQMKEDPEFGDNNYQYSALKSSVSTNNPEESRVLEITVTAASPEEAKAIVDKICDVGSEKIKDTMRVDQVNILEYGTLEKSPVNITKITTYLLVGIVAAVVVYLIFLVIFFFDDRIRDNDNIEQTLNLTVLGDIPDATDAKKFGRGYYKRSYRSGYKGQKITEGAMKNE